MASKINLGFLIGVIVASVAIGVSATAPPDYSFDCGEDEPPSGPYFSIIEDQYYDYDCSTKLLSPSSLSAEDCKVDTVNGVAKPVRGICLVLNPVNDGYAKMYDWEGLIAVVSSASRVEIETFDRDNVSEDEKICFDEPNNADCNGIWLSNTVVTYWYVGGHWQDSYCYHHVSTGTIYAELSSGGVKKQAAQDAKWCQTS